jgi:cell division protein FtsX
MRTWLRHHQYAFLVALRRLKVQPFSSLSNLLVIALTLAVPVLGASILLAAQPVVREIPTSPEMTVFMKQNSTLEQAQAFSQAVGKEFQAELAQIRLVSKEQALKQLQSNPSWTDALGALPSNPLPHAIVLTLHETPDLVTRADTLAKTLQGREGVDSVLLDSEWVQRLALSASKLAVGSSAIKIAGRFTIARAIASRCCSPPDISTGFKSSLPRKPTFSMAARARAWAVLGSRPMTARGRSTLARALRSCSKCVSCKTTPTARRR